MKVAEALILRADYQKRFEQLKQRLQQNARVQEGDTPAEAPADLLQELEQVATDLTQLIQQINRTNSTVALAPHGTLADALAVRDVLKLRISVYRDLAQAASVNSMRTTRSEIKFRSTISVAEIQKQADQLAKAYRELDAQIQAANWLTDLHM
jgi:D-alanyl-D-alanine dipeptidase